MLVVNTLFAVVIDFLNNYPHHLTLTIRWLTKNAYYVLGGVLLRPVKSMYLYLKEDAWS
jgi:hypothetical protein